MSIENENDMNNQLNNALLDKSSNIYKIYLDFLTYL